MSESIITALVGIISAMGPVELVKQALAKLSELWTAQGLEPEAFKSVVDRANGELDAQMARDDAIEAELLKGPKA